MADHQLAEPLCPLLIGMKQQRLQACRFPAVPHAENLHRMVRAFQPLEKFFVVVGLKRIRSRPRMRSAPVLGMIPAPDDLHDRGNIPAGTAVFSGHLFIDRYDKRRHVQRMVFRADDGLHAPSDDFLTGPPQRIRIFFCRQRLNIIGKAAQHGESRPCFFKACAVPLYPCPDAVDVAIINIPGQSHILKTIIAEQGQLVDIGFSLHRESGFRVAVSQQDDAVRIFRCDHQPRPVFILILPLFFLYSCHTSAPIRAALSSGGIFPLGFKPRNDNLLLRKEQAQIPKKHGISRVFRVLCACTADGRGFRLPL